MISILFYMLCGYVLAVIFPIPWVSRSILDVWAQVGAYIAEKKRQNNY